MLVDGREAGELWANQMTSGAPTARGDKHGSVLSVHKYVSQPSPAVAPHVILHLSACSLAALLHAQLQSLGCSAADQIAKDWAFHPHNC